MTLIQTSSASGPRLRDGVWWAHLLEYQHGLAAPDLTARDLTDDR